jgi:hypothetical protein
MCLSDISQGDIDKVLMLLWLARRCAETFGGGGHSTTHTYSVTGGAATTPGPHDVVRT